MDSVYNRKLFQRKEDRAARDQLRKMGGIMSSSEDLMQAAQQGFRPSQDPQMTGQGQVVSMAPSIVPSAQDMMAMQQQRQVQQMRSPQQPPQQPQQMREPQPGMGQPPQMQPSVQAPQQQPMGQRRGFQEGGPARASMGEPRMSRATITEDAAATSTGGPVTVTQVPTAPGPDPTAPSSPAEALEKAKSLIEDPQIPAEEKAKAIVQASGEPSSGDLVQDIRALYQQSVGGEIPRDATIDELNRGIFGAVMAQSKNPRAAGAFAEGLAAALGAMRDTEMGRQDREMGLKGTEFQVRAGREDAAIRGALSGSNSQGEAFDEITKIFQSLTTTGNYTGEQAVKYLNDMVPGLGDQYIAYLAGKANVPTTPQEPGPGGTNSAVVPPSDTTQLLNAANAAIQRINSSTSSIEQKQAEYQKVQDQAARLGINNADLMPLSGG